MNNAVSVTNLTVHYSSHHAALQGVNFSVHEGEFVVIIGKSGSGKSTLLHALAGFIPYAGAVTVTGKLGMVFQTYAVFPWLTVEENIGFGLNRMKREERVRIIEEHLRLIGMCEKRRAYPAQLSGGQVQRVALAQTLAHNPDVILMDEPYGALDAYTREQMQAWLLDVWSTHKKTVVFVTHSIEEAILLADRVLILVNGAIQYEYLVPYSRPRALNLKYQQSFCGLEQQIHAKLQE